MNLVKKATLFYSIIVCTVFIACQPKPEPSILVFTKTEGFRHESIPSGIEMFKKLSAERGLEVTNSENSKIFKEKNLKNFGVVVFLNTTLDILNDAQQYEFKRYIQAGGSFLGIHGAADTEYDWPWYGKLVGAYFNGHPNNPNVRDAVVEVVDATHSSCSHLPEKWDRKDEWYNYKSINPDINVVLNLDESTYEGGTNGENHPLAWHHEFDGGRAFYTGGGHTSESYSEEHFVRHIRGALDYLLPIGRKIDYSSNNVQPSENRFQKVVYADNLNEPMELEILPDGRLIFIERDGALKLTNPETNETRVIDSVRVFSELEDGLLGMALDPTFAENSWVYLFYSNPDVDIQHLSRFSFDADAEKPLTDEKILLTVPTQREECCHSAGSIEFDRHGNLFVSTGDNTNPHQSDGHAPIDNRKNRSPFDARKSSANTHDLRGKILRITPTDEGEYTIPDGNLFAKNGSEGRPEIYIMGCRNPYRFAVDMHDNRLFWGEVGPDGNEDKENYGPRGYDEVNMAKAAGNFGWPLFIGNNKAYRERDFYTDGTGDYFDPQNPVNNSPNNTGVEILPPAQEAMLYYPYDKSPDFPDMGSGGRNAMAGPIYYEADYGESEIKFPSYYDGKFFAYEWMRGWIKTVTFDENGDYVYHESFMPSTKWNNLIDVEMSPQGDMYMLEYGTGWFTKNKDARISRLKYIKGNRDPIAQFEADKTAGATPMIVNFDAFASEDPDGDPMNYVWDFGDGNTGKGATVSHTFETSGTYKVVFTVKDKKGLTSQNQINIYAGNEPPKVSWKLDSGNESFFIPGKAVSYTVKVIDKEDGSLGNGIAVEDVTVTIDFLKEGYDIVESAIGHQALSELGQSSQGMRLIDESDCKLCHKRDEKSIGPTYLNIAKKYEDDDSAASYLPDKIINGGGGVWGETAMAAHPDIGEEVAEKMADYIIGLGEEKILEKLPPSGSYVFDKNPMEYPNSSYVLTASYLDKGADGAERLHYQDVKILRPPIIMAASASEMDKATKFTITKDIMPDIPDEVTVLMVLDDASIIYKDVDLTNISGLTIAYSAPKMFMSGGELSLFLDDAESEAIGSGKLKTSASFGGNTFLNIPLNGVSGKHDLIFKVKAKEGSQAVASLLSLSFSS